MAAENAGGFKERMPAVAEERDRAAADRARGEDEAGEPPRRGPGGRRAP